VSPLPARLPEPTNAPLRGGPTLRWGVLAPGEIANDWVATVHVNTDQRVVAVASRTAERAEAFAARHGIPRSYGGYERLVADPEVDIVYVAAPHTEHPRLALLAIAAGKHVLVEKPMAVSRAAAAEIVDAAVAAGVFAMEAMWSRFLPQTTVIARLLSDGAVGVPRSASADFGGVFPFDPVSRAFDPALGGGALLDVGVYSLWFTDFALGSATSVSARGSLATTGVDEQAVVLTEHQGPALGVAAASMVANTPHAAVVSGDDAWIQVDRSFWAPGGFTLGTPDEQLRWSDPSGIRGRGGLCYQATAVAAHIATGRIEAPEHPHETTLRVLGIIDEARRQLGAR
jgi:predicted dehydrogenase